MTEPRYGWTPSIDQVKPRGLPSPRGPLSALLIDQLAGPVRGVGRPPAYSGDPVHGEDAALALYVLYELHYRGFADVDEDWEWEPSLLATRAELERDYIARVTELVGPVPEAGDVVTGLQAAMSVVEGPSLSMYAAERADLRELRELAVHRSAWQLKEADPHSWAIPRLAGRPKAALIEIQKDEYGEGVQRDMHQVLFGLTMESLGLDASYGAYLDHLPAVTLATVNLVSMFGLHRKWRGALCGHLATFEMTSVAPMGNYAAAMRRLGMSTDSRHFYEVHVVADAHHSSVGAEELAGGLVEQEPELLPQVLFGAAAVSVLERHFADHVLDSFGQGETSLLKPLERRSRRLVVA
ncbi:MAG: hypothetical protein QOK42_1564 [Frankiaceae bacterium]|nr:hypothetical protein [Frankiaceae bacterium]